MSLYIHVGQCGNQIALPFWKLAEAEIQSSVSSNTSNNTLFDDFDGFSRAIFIDSEPKVVAKTCKSLTKVRPSNVILETSGCGNNWSMGFQSCFAETDNRSGSSRLKYGIDDRSQSLFSASVETIRRESERCDSMRSIVMMHSIGGGIYLAFLIPPSSSS
jgi:hypothetical protein